MPFSRDPVRCARCGEPFGGNRAVAYMAYDQQALRWDANGQRAGWDWYLKGHRAPVCRACVGDAEAKHRTYEAPCAGGCGLVLQLISPDKRGAVCSSACAQRRRRRLKRSKAVPRLCVHCGDLFTPTRKDGRFCRSACRQAAYRQRRAAGVGSTPWTVNPPSP